MISIVNKQGLAVRAENLNKTFNGVLGISVFKTLFTADVVRDIVQFGTQLCKEFVVLVVDYPERWNGLLYGKNSIAEAEEYAKDESKTKQEAFRNALDEAGFHSVPIWSWYRFLGEPTYERNQKVLLDYFHSDKNFRKRLIMQVVQNISPRLVQAQKRLGRRLLKKERESISMYFLEEIGGLFYLFFDLGYALDIYPGKNSWLIEEIYANKFPELTKALGYDWSKQGYIVVG